MARIGVTPSTSPEPSLILENILVLKVTFDSVRYGSGATIKSTSILPPLVYSSSAHLRTGFGCRLRVVLHSTRLERWHHMSISLNMQLVQLLIFSIGPKCFLHDLTNLFLVQLSLFGLVPLAPLLIDKKFNFHKSMIHFQIVKLCHLEVVEVYELHPLPKHFHFLY